MIDKALGLQSAVREAVNTETAISLASVIVFGYSEMSEEMMKKTVMALVSEVASMASFYSAEVLLGEDGMNDLNETIHMLQSLGEEE